MTKLIRAFIAMSLLALLSACGGGGGSAGNTSGVPLFTTAAEKITIVPGASQVYNIGGGVPGYVATSSTGAASVKVEGKILTITATGAGTATITVNDAAGAKVTIAATIGTGVDLFTSAPEKLTLGVGQTSTSFTIGGGSQIYTVSSGNRQSVLVNHTGSQFSLTGLAAGVSTVTITDSLGGIKKVEVTVGSGVDLFTTAPSTVVISVGSTSATYQIGGGSEVYAVASSDRNVATIIQTTGRSFAVIGQTGGRAVVSVTDTLGKVVKIDIVVGSLVDLYTTAPSLVTVAVGSASAVYSIGGGSQIYAVTSSDKRIATVGQTTLNEFIITGQTGGKAVVTVKDTNGKEIKIDVVVGTVDALYSTAASEITLEVGGANSYKVGGGTTLYSVGSSNVGVARATINGNDLVVTGVGTGKATLVVRDSTTGNLTINVTVGGGTPMPLFTSALSDIVIAPSTSPTFTIGGGRAPYQASSGNTSVVTAIVNSSTLTLTGVAVGNAKVIVQDAAGTIVPINITVGTGTVIPLFTTAPGSVTLVSSSTATYAIGGGTPPYSVNSSNLGVATVVVNGLSYTVTGKTAGTADLLIRDSLGASTSVALTVSSTGALPLTLLPGDSTGSVGDTLNFRISGGSGPFVITNNNPSIATVVQTEETFTAKLLNVGSTTVIVTDSQGISKQLVVTATAANSVLRISPSNIEIGEDSTASFNMEVKGGTAPYRVFTGDMVMSSVSISGSMISVGLGSRSSRCIHPVDDSGTYQRGSLYEVTITVLDKLGSVATSKLQIRDNSRGIGPVDSCGN
jgi:hypothetical protein